MVSGSDSGSYRRFAQWVKHIMSYVDALRVPNSLDIIPNGGLQSIHRNNNELALYRSGTTFTIPSPLLGQGLAQARCCAVASRNTGTCVMYSSSNWSW